MASLGSNLRVHGRCILMSYRYVTGGVSNHWIGIWTGMEWNGQSSEIMKYALSFIAVLQSSVLQYSSIITHL